MRESRPAKVAVGALLIALPASGALTPTQSFAKGTAAPAQTPEVLPFELQASHIGYGSAVVVSGATPSGAAGQSLALQFAPPGSSTWQTLSQATASSGDRFRLSAQLTSSGAVRVLDASLGSAIGPATAGTSTGAVSALATSSTIRHVVVNATLRVRRHRISALGGSTVVLRGRLLPAVGGRVVRLLGLTGRAWHTLASAGTRSRGAFAIRYQPQATGRLALRVKFAGDRSNARASTRAGALTVYRESVASWYDDGGSTGCGFHAYYGVANRDLPCGTAVEFRSGSRTVTAVVDDRGPYVGGRDWDLNQNSAAALGVVGVQTVWASR